VTLRDEQGLKRGDRIPGSRYFRDFCKRCETPMRVGEAGLRIGVCCEDCEPRQLSQAAATQDDLSPWQENAIRAMEECE